MCYIGVRRTDGEVSHYSHFDFKVCNFLHTALSIIELQPQWCSSASAGSRAQVRRRLTRTQTIQNNHKEESHAYLYLQSLQIYLPLPDDSVSLPGLREGRRPRSNRRGNQRLSSDAGHSAGRDPDGPVCGDGLTRNRLPAS